MTASILLMESATDLVQPLQRTKLAKRAHTETKFQPLACLVCKAAQLAQVEQLMVAYATQVAISIQSPTLAVKKFAENH